MKYVTFLASSERWTLFKGVGLKGSQLGERARPPELIDFSMTLNAMLWIASGGGENSSLQRVKLPELSTEQAVEAEGRLTALAAAPDGQKVVALRVPRAPGQRPSLVIWNGHDWLDLKDDIVPDISSRLAWIDEHLIVFESSSRRLGVCDLETGKVTNGPPGHSPTAAPLANRWYAVQKGRIVAFAVGRDVQEASAPVNGFRFGVATSLRASLDGEVLTWTEPRWWFGNKSYVQQRGHRRTRCGAPDEICVVSGPYDFSKAVQFTP